MTDTSSLSHLIERLEKATAPDWRLSADIFREVGLPDTFFGSKVISWFGDGPFGCNTEDGRRHLDCINAPPYTSSIDAAMTLKPGYHKYILGSEWCAVWQEDGRYNDAERVPTRNRPAIALCIAALKAQLSTRTNEQDDARNLSGVSSE